MKGSGADIFQPESNAGFLTFDGVEVFAQRVFLEVIAYIEDQEANGITYNKISIVGYSLGGLCGRYLIGLMDEKGMFDRYEPFSYTSFATPHVGSYFHKTAPQYGILNFLGSNILGISGNDLFLTKSTVLVDMADPNGKFYRALKKFNHLTLFANTLHDRTVPFFTAYISRKDPFGHRDYLNTVLDPLEAGRDGKLMDQTVIDQWPPMFVNMNKSTYTGFSHTGQDAKPTTEETTMNYVMLIVLPLILPAVAGVTTAMTLVSLKRASDFKQMNYAEKYKEAQKRVKQRRLRLADGKMEKHHPSEDVAEAAVDALDDLLPSENNRHSSHHNVDTKLGSEDLSPRSSTGDGYAGLIEQTPHELNLPSHVTKVIDDLNTLPWEKYAVRLKRMHSHAEIINRRDKPGQGELIVEFFAELMARKMGVVDA